MPEMTEDVKSRLWCTYRKNFKAISEYMDRECKGREREREKERMTVWWSPPLQVALTSPVTRAGAALCAVGR